MEEIIEQQNDLIFNEKIKSHLLVYAKWSKFLGIIAYIGAGFMVLLGFAYLFISALTASQPLSTIYKVFMFGIMLVCGIIYAIGANYMLRSSKQLKHGILTNNQESTENGIGYQKKLFRFIGIVTIVGLCLYPIMIAVIIYFTSNNILYNM